MISGDLKFAIKVQNILLEDARRRRSPLHQGWGLFGVAANNLRLGNAAEAVPMLEEALQILEEIPNTASSINTNGMIALAYLRVGQDEQALLYADKVLKLAENLSPTVYSLNMGFTAMADVYFQIWEKSLHDPSRKLLGDQLKASALRALKPVRAFEKVFPIGQPQTPYYEGWYEWLAGDQSKALRLWQKSLEAAQKFNMRYEEGRAHLQLGLTTAEPVTRAEHLQQAVTIFEKMGAVYEEKIAKENLSRNK
jgi:tetratricopeptide (TPR) repeat protein